VVLNDREGKELIFLARSSSLKTEIARMSVKDHNPIMVNGRVDADKWIMFLNGYNEFINHTMRPFHKMIDRVMKL